MGVCASISSLESKNASRPPSARSFSHARTIAVPHDAVPIEPPASDANGRALSPMSTRTRSSGTSSASAAICVRTVRDPVPMSDAAIRTT